MTEPSPGKKSLPSEKKILIIDDDDGLLAVLRTTFDIEGFQVQTSRDGRNILQKAVQFKPDLIISDLMMPGGGGYEVLRSLQTDPLTRDIPVFMITGSSMAASTKQVMQQESNLAGYYEKPFRPETLVKSVHQKLNTISRAEQSTMPGKQAPLGFDDVF